MHGHSEKVLRELERPSKDPLEIWRKGGIFWVAVEEPDVCVVEPVQNTTETENVPAFR